MRYFGLDGDNIGRQIEHLLIENKVNETKLFSQKIWAALNQIQEEVLSNGGEVIFCSGDSILFHGEFENSFASKIISDFYKKTGKTASLGIGSSLAKTYLGLKLAKAKGGNQFVDYNKIEI